MPKGSKKSGTKTGRHWSQHTTKSDFTLYDFAHCVPAQSPVVTSGRLKKGEANAFRTQVKEVCGKSMLSENSLTWFERDLSDFDASDGEDWENSYFSESEATARVTRQHKRSLRNKDSLDHHHHNGALTYPLDIWFLIGKYIRPEDVASFSAICRHSHFVVHSARFWSSLYRRFYVSSTDMPVALEPSMLVRIHGLKSRVVRSLFYFYPPFQRRLRCLAPFENDPDCLEGTRCVRMWYQQIKQVWHFFFKFRRLVHISCPVYPNAHQSCAESSLLADANILYNPEEQNIVLQVISPSFILLPEVVGQLLIKASVSVGHEMRSHRLKLVFNPTHVQVNKVTLTNGTTVVMDPVTNIHVLRWWDPKYPCRF